ncbi:scarecrow-like protein 32 [Chenopodium quinoa]|uniref:scarecrow-like protein 32 n=1 Tax=Chenopodium quinoa TaxID=63459 RepID=UPI000B775E40|nr:scarecrow-like protein 32 [Chenopodium quinoa]
MMQFTEISNFPTPNTISFHQSTTMMNRIRPWPGFTTSKQNTSSSSSSSSSFNKNNCINNHNLGDANYMEQLLVHCAQAIDNNDATPAQQILWVLNNIAPPDGDSNQRLTCAFLRALILRAARTPACKFILNSATSNNNNDNNNNSNINTSTTITTSSSIACGINLNIHKFSLLDLANFVHLTPWHRFGFTAANSVILEAIEGRTGVHIVDLSVTHCMQIPTLIDSIATRYQGRQPPTVTLTVGAFTQQGPPMFDFICYDDLGVKLINFARSKGVVLEFKAVPTTPSDGFASVLDEVRTRQEQMRFLYGNPHHQEELEEEALIINCQMSLHYLNHAEPEEDPSVVMSMRSMFFKALRSLSPTMVVVVEEDVDFTSRNLVGRLRSAFNYFWIPFDTVDTFLPRGSKQREWYEADICWKIENVISHEGDQRVERQEPRTRWSQRMMEAEFRAVGLTGEATMEVKAMLEEHATGWGSKKEEEDIVLTWKGHNVVFATALVPS